MVNSMSVLDHSFQSRYTEIKVEPTSGVTAITENADDADDAEHGPIDHKLVFEQANVRDATLYVSLPGTVPSDAILSIYANVPRDNITIHENIAYASSKQS